MTSVALNYPVREVRTAAKPQVRVVRGGHYSLAKLKALVQRVLLVMAIMVAATLVVGVVASQARITELSGQIEKARADLVDQKSTNDYLTSTMDSITSRTNTQEVAERALGLVKADASQMTYITLEGESVITKSDSNATRAFDSFRTAALSLMNNLDP